jgi:hypothetical protein
MEMFKKRRFGWEPGTLLNNPGHWFAQEVKISAGADFKLT